MKLKCNNKKNYLGQCENCGLYHNISKIDIETVLIDIKWLMKINGKHFILYKLDSINQDRIFIHKKIFKFFKWLYYSWVSISIKDIDNIVKFLSYLYYEKHINISEYATIFFGYLSIYLHTYDKFYYYWSKLAIKSESYIVIKWVIEDYKNGACKYRKKNLKKAQKLIKISQNLKKDFVES